MKLIAKNGELSRTLLRLFKGYPNAKFAVAWASAGTDVFDLLKSEQSIVKQAVIGTHFYQTHPDVLDAFVDSDKVRFKLQTSGIFHPKVYLFWDARHWEALVGSANLTHAALNVNSEIVLHVSDSDDGADQVRVDVECCIDGYHSSAERISSEYARRYRALWGLRRPEIDKLSGHFGKEKKQRLPIESNIMSLDWDGFIARIEKRRSAELEERTDLLEFSRSQFTNSSNFVSMSTAARFAIAGLPGEGVNPLWAWFGSMRGSGEFWSAVKANSPLISEALSAIALDGEVQHVDYLRYCAEFSKAFKWSSNPLATGTRLLALKRPDQFVCFDSANKRKLCQDFGIKHDQTFESYWDSVIMRIRSSPWWNAAEPRNGSQRKIWQGRVAMLDCFYYRDSDRKSKRSKKEG